MTNLTTYLFVDGGHLRKYYEEFANKWFGNNGELDFAKIKADFNADKCFYFDCDDDGSKFRGLRKSNWRVELGYLSGKKRTQKEVDTLIAVSMVRYAHIGKMDKAILLAGDGDFRPVVEELIRMDIDVQIVGDKKHTSQRLMGEATSVQLLDIDDYYRWTKESVKITKPLENIKRHNANNHPKSLPESSKSVKKGLFNEKDVTLIHEGEKLYYLVHYYEDNLYWLEADNQEDLLTFFELKYGKIDW